MAETTAPTGSLGGDAAGSRHTPLGAERRAHGGRELRTVEMVWRRELIRWGRARSRILTALIQPVLFLFVLGVGLTPLVGETAGFDFKQFIFPGVVAMSVVTTAIFSAISVVWDREFGFLREMLVAPVRRSSLVLGKTIGGATVASIQGAIMLGFAPLVGVRLTPQVVVGVLAVSMLMAFALTSFGVFVASRIKKMENFQVVMQFLLLPMLFLSGALFPLNNLPGWLAVLTRLNPLTYAVDLLRRAVFSAEAIPAAVAERFGTGVEVFGTTLPVWSEVLILIVFAAVFLSLSVRAFVVDE